MTHIIANVGTSASAGPMRNAAFKQQYGDVGPRLNAASVEKLGGVAAAVAALEPYFLEYDFTSDKDLGSGLSAEIHSIVRLQQKEPDKLRDATIYLMYSDTPDGEVCAKLDAAYLTKRMGIVKVIPIRITGLQVDDPDRFRKEGLPNYFREVEKIGNQWGWQNVILNPTGGFKALVSYTTLIGMFYGLRVLYIFEFSTSLFELPTLPVDFDEARLRSLLAAADRIEKESEIPEQEFWGDTPHELRQQWDGLVENGDEKPNVTLSAIGLLAFGRLRQRIQGEALTLYLSLEAWQDLLKAPKDWAVDRFLHQCHSRTALDKYLHASVGGDRRQLKWLKPGNTSDRYLVELQDNKLLVYRIVGHQVYENMVNKIPTRASMAPFTRYEYVE